MVVRWTNPIIEKSGNNILMSQIFDCRDCGREVRVTLSDDAEIVGNVENVEIVCGICAYENHVEDKELVIELKKRMQEFLKNG